MNTSGNGRCHKAVVVEVGSHCEEIDEAIAPLIEALWRTGIKTMMSCQEADPGIAWIEFDDMEHVQKFLNLVADYEEGADTLYNRITHDLITSTSATPMWEYQLNPLDCGGDEEGRRQDRDCDFIFTVGVYIPHADLPVVLDRLCRMLPPTTDTASVPR